MSVEPVAIFYNDNDKHGQVRCPKCYSVFPVKQHQNKGAGYAKSTMSELKPDQFDLLTWWLSNEMYREDLTKSKLINLFRIAGGFLTDPDARISELVGLELITMTKNGNDVTYSLNITPVSKVISNGGKLHS